MKNVYHSIKQESEMKNKSKKLSDRLKEARGRFDEVKGPNHTLLALDMDIGVDRLRKYINEDLMPKNNLYKILKYLRKKGL